MPADFARIEASRLTRVHGNVAVDPTVGRRPMPRTPTTNRPGFVPVAKPWRCTKVHDDGRKVVLSAHDKQETAEAHAGCARDALTDAEVGEGWNVVAERARRGKR